MFLAQVYTSPHPILITQNYLNQPTQEIIQYTETFNASQCG
jgi:hypothetical protein